LLMNIFKELGPGAFRNVKHPPPGGVVNTAKEAVEIGTYRTVIVKPLKAS